MPDQPAPDFEEARGALRARTPLALFRHWRSERRLTALIREGFRQIDDAQPEPVPPELIERTVAEAKRRARPLPTEEETRP